MATSQPPAGTTHAEAANARAALAVGEIEAPLTEALRRVQCDGRLFKHALIIGDDTSGRIPALIVRRVVNQARRSAGLGPVPLWFLPGSGGRGEMGAAATRVLEDRAPAIAGIADGEPALLVTDCMFVGTSMASMAMGLRMSKVPCDVIAVMAHPWFYSRHPFIPEDVHVYVGIQREAQLHIDGDHSLSGVAKIPTPRALRGSTIHWSVSAARREARAAADRISATLGIG